MPAIRGQLDLVFLVDVLNMVATTTRACRVELGPEDRLIGAIWMRDGHVVDALTSGRRGRAAFMELFSNRRGLKGEFRVYYLEDTEIREHTICHLNLLLLEAAQREDEGRPFPDASGAHDAVQQAV
jgi:hypothetical protein